MNNRKLTDFISYPTNLNLHPYIVNETDNKAPYYSLQAVIVHSGKFINEGHYYYYVKDPHDNWHLMNDSEVKGVTSQVTQSR